MHNDLGLQGIPSSLQLFGIIPSRDRNHLYVLFLSKDTAVQYQGEHSGLPAGPSCTRAAVWP